MLLQQTSKRPFTVADASVQLIILDELKRCSSKQEVHAIQKQIDVLESYSNAILDYVPPAGRPAVDSKLSYLDQFSTVHSLFIALTGVDAVMGEIVGAALIANLVKWNKARKAIKYHEHHSFPKFMGGAVNQALTKLKMLDHIKLHQKMNKFLKTKTTIRIEKGAAKIRDMYARKGNSGKIIREVFTEEEIKMALKEFYKGPGKEFKKAAKDFFKQIGEK